MTMQNREERKEVVSEAEVASENNRNLPADRKESKTAFLSGNNFFTYNQSSKVRKLLQLVTEGEQEQVETMLKEDPLLASTANKVVDPAGRTFTNITGFQYAIWSLDWHMWRMFLKYLPKEEAKKQLVALESMGIEHGANFSLTPLLQALTTYKKNYDSWDYLECCEHWGTEVGKQQRLLPVHVVNEYCHTTRSFSPTPSFTEDYLPRNRIILTKKPIEWHMLLQQDDNAVEKSDDDLNLPLACDRGSSLVVRAGIICDDGTKHIEIDLTAIQKLSEVRVQQLLSLKTELFNENNAVELKAPEEKTDLITKIIGR